MPVILLQCGFREVRVVHIITGLKRGGAERTLYSLITVENDIEHVVISLGAMDYYGELCESAGAKVIALNMKGVLPAIRGTVKLRSILKSVDASVVQTWMYHANFIGGLVAKASGYSVVWNIRMTNPFSSSYSKLTQFVARISSTVSGVVPNRIVYCAQSAKLMHEQHGYATSKGVVITNGYDLDTYRPQESQRRCIRKQLDIEDSTLVFGAVGRYDSVKNYKGLIEALSSFAFNHAEPWLCIFIGNDMDAENDELNSLITSSNLTSNIRLIGPVADIAPWHNALDFLVSNSLDEGFPNVIAESQACGTPAIVTDVGDSADIIGNNGWVVPSNSPNELVSALVSAADIFNTDKYAQIASACRLRATERLNINTMCQSYEAIWQALSKKSRK